MKKCFCFLSFCLFFWGCNLVPKEELYKIEHNGNTIIVQRVMGNATSANYLQIIENGERILNIREENIIVDHIECNDSLFVVYKKQWSSDKENFKIDTMYIGTYSKNELIKSDPLQLMKGQINK